MNSPIKIQCGDLRTPIRIQTRTSTRQAGKLDTVKQWLDIGAVSPDEVRYKRCQFISSHGSEVVSQDAAVGRQSAVIRIRCDRRINNKCRVLIGDEQWDIDAVDDVRRLGVWMELNISRDVTA